MPEPLTGADRRKAIETFIVTDALELFLIGLTNYAPYYDGQEGPLMPFVGRREFMVRTLDEFRDRDLHYELWPTDRDIASEEYDLVTARSNLLAASLFRAAAAAARVDPSVTGNLFEQAVSHLTERVAGFLAGVVPAGDDDGRGLHSVAADKRQQ